MFAVALSAVAFFIIFLSNFIWDIDVIGCEHMLEKDIVDILNKKGISIGKSKHNINFEKIENEIKIENPKIAWIGIDIEGTKINAQIKEAIEIPDVISEITGTSQYTMLITLWFCSLLFLSLNTTHNANQ